MKRSIVMKTNSMCPLCKNKLTVEKCTWDGLTGSVFYVACYECKIKGEGATSEGEAFIKFDKRVERKRRENDRKPEKILTDIRDYLLAQDEIVRKRNIDYLSESAMHQLLIIEYEALKEYAAKLGVEL